MKRVKADQPYVVNSGVFIYLRTRTVGQALPFSFSKNNNNVKHVNEMSKCMPTDAEILLSCIFFLAYNK